MGNARPPALAIKLRCGLVGTGSPGCVVDDPRHSPAKNKLPSPQYHGDNVPSLEAPFRLVMVSTSPGFTGAGNSHSPLPGKMAWYVWHPPPDDGCGVPAPGCVTWGIHFDKSA